MERLAPGVKALHGDPRRAVLRISFPTIAAMAGQTAYNVVDAIWVAALLVFY